MTTPLPDHEPRCPGVKVTLEIPVSLGLATAATLPECRNCLRRTTADGQLGPTPTMEPPIYAIMGNFILGKAPACPLQIES